MGTVGRRRRRLAVALLASLSFAALMPSGSAQQATCDLELVLAVDTSASVDHEEYRLQSVGFATAFRDPAVIAAIRSIGGVAVTVIHWSSVDQQWQAVDWRLLRDARSARAFAAEIERVPRRFSLRGTGLGLALRFAERLIVNNGFRCRRQVIDVSGDGQNNVGEEPHLVRDFVVASGITINGLAILSDDPQLDIYYRADVVGGDGAFVITAESYQHFREAIRIKLLREISPNLARAEMPPEAGATGSQ